MTTRLTLRMPLKWILKLEAIRKKEEYTSTQQMLYDLIRERYIKEQKKEPGTRGPGRPKKMAFEDYFSNPTRESKKIERMYR